jgi:hypothetical protein
MHTKETRERESREAGCRAREACGSERTKLTNHQIYVLEDTYS